MHLKEENHSKLFQPTFGWHSTWAQCTPELNSQLRSQVFSVKSTMSEIHPLTQQLPLAPWRAGKQQQPLLSLQRGWSLGQHTGSFVSLQAPQFPTSILAWVQGQTMSGYHQSTSYESSVWSFSGTQGCRDGKVNRNTKTVRSYVPAWMDTGKTQAQL